MTHDEAKRVANKVKARFLDDYSTFLSVSGDVTGNKWQLALWSGVVLAEVFDDEAAVLRYEAGKLRATARSHHRHASTSGIEYEGWMAAGDACYEKADELELEAMKLCTS